MLIDLPVPLILGSMSPSRNALLKAAGLEFETDPAGIDEDAITKLVMRGKGAAAGDVAEILARAKAESVSNRHPGALVIGSDQVLALGGELFQKPDSEDEARKTLLALQGKTHQLHCAVALARDGDVHWAHVETAQLTMRALSPEDIGRYLADAGVAVLSSVGAYQLEGLGVHLFEKISGDYFTILGLPLLALLSQLRTESKRTA